MLNMQTDVLILKFIHFLENEVFFATITIDLILVIQPCLITTF